MSFPKQDNVVTLHYLFSLPSVSGAVAVGPQGRPGPPGPPGPPGTPGTPGHSSGSHSASDYRRYIMEYMQSEFLFF